MRYIAAKLLAAGGRIADTVGYDSLPGSPYGKFTLDMDSHLDLNPSVAALASG